MNFNPTFRLPEVLDLIKSSTATASATTESNHKNSTTSPLDAAAFSALMMNGANLATSHIGAASAASFTNGNGVSPLIPDMNDPAVISQLLSTFSQQQQEQLQQAASQPQLPLKAESPKSHQQQPGALDLTAISDQFQKQQFAELMFLKQMRSMLGYQPQDSNESMMTMPQATMGEQLGKIEKSSSPSLQSANKTTAVTTPHQAPPTSQPSSVSSPSIDHQEVPSSNTPLDHLLQLYGINRESYLKLLQHQEQLKQQPQPFEQQKSHETARSIDLRSPSKGFERSQTVTEEEDEDSSNEGSIDAEPVSHPSDSSSQELEKLKQLQSLYKLNLMQQQFQPSPPPPPSSLQADLTDFSFLPSLKTKKPSAGSASSATSSSNDNYVEMLHQKATAGGKTPSRRPLSSWKQSITACGPGPAPWVDKSTLYSLGIQGELINRTGPIDYTNFVKRYGNAHECGNSLCRELNYREHFHCNATSCNSRVFMKKEEMIRHFKWHKKRDESLTHGFLRCSPADNCVERFRACPHHRKQTHYHCLKRGCDKVYISTSDVQMHANYHRKDTAIIHEGFQRFRATENCLLETCAFFGQKTTHFHCRRDNCDHTFKNKADMEKHKSYHVRDEQLARDGFRKFQKHEDCAIDACRSSRVCNHIHCIRPGCQHVLHSTGQLFPHKRKHERREYEWAYRKYRLAQILRQNPDASGPALEKTLSEGLDVLSEDDSVMDNLVAQLPLTQFVVIPLEEIVGESIGEARIRKYIQRHPNAGCQRIDSDELKSSSMLRSEHFTCLSCGRCWSDYADAIQHAHKHALQEHANVLLFEETADPNICSAECILHQKDRHLHCRMFGCPFITLQTDKTLSQLEHYKFHEDQMDQFGPNADCEIKLNNNGLQIEGLQHVKIDLSAQPIAPISQGVRPSNKNKNGSPTHQVFPTGTTLTSVDGMPVLKRKRGRPPKNRSSDSSQSRNHSASSPFGFGSNGAAAFDLAAALNLSLAANGAGQDGKTIPIPLLMNQYLKQNIPLPTQLPSLAGFYGFDDKSPCPDMFCRYFGTPHYHCCRPRCYFATNREDSANSHTRDFHENVDILDWFAYFDSAIDCKMAGCNLNRSSSHFHCTRPDCNTSFAPYALMRVHDAKHNKSSDNSGIDSMKDVGETNDWQLQLQNLIAQQSKMMNSCNTTPIKEEEPDVIEPEVTPVDEPSSKTEDPNMLMVGLQAQFAQNPALAGNFLQMLMSTLMNQAGGSSTVPPVDQSGGESKAGDSQMSSPRKRRGSFSSEASSTASEYLKRPKIEEASSTSVNSVFL